MSPPNNFESFRPIESSSNVGTNNNEVPSSRVQNGHNNRSRRLLSIRRRQAVTRVARNSRRQRIRNGNTFNAMTDDDDFHFFISLLPYLQDVPKNIRLRIRNKVQRVIIKQLEQYNNTNNERPSNNLNNNNRTLSPSPTNYHSVTPQEELSQVQYPIQYPLPVYPFVPNYNHVYGNVNNFVTPLQQNSEYSFPEQRVMPSYARQRIYQPVPHLAGQQSLPLFAGQQQYNTPYFSRQQYNTPHFTGQLQHNYTSQYSEQQPIQSYDYQD